MKRVADYILDYLVSQRVDNVFLITGGAIAFVVDAFHSRKDIKYTCFAHEQGAAMAADAYARLGPGIAATMVTSGPGATNLLTGIACSWFDSIPVIHISGQVNTYEQKNGSKARQVGFQETDIVTIAKPLTKFSEQLDKAENIRYLLEKATYIAKSGRPGPVLIDIPMDFQRVEIDPKKLKGYEPPVDNVSSSDAKIDQAITLLKKAERPVLLIGGGVRLADATQEALQLAKKLNIPVVSSWSGLDSIPFDHPLRIGEIGVYGNRAANFTIQNADVILSIGSRLDTRQTGGRPDTFARGAKLIMVDIDKAELDKRRGLTPAISIAADAKEFIGDLLAKLNGVTLADTSDWLAKTQDWRKRYPTVLKEFYAQKQYVNPYAFVDILSQEANDNAIVIPDDGGHLTWTMQAFKVKPKQRLFSAFGNSPMGFSLPAAIGAAIAVDNKRQVICVDGDGSIQMNIQELQTIVGNKLDVKIFVLHNNGYGIIKQFQELYLDSRFEATGKGVTIPDFSKIAEAYGIKAITIKNHTELRRKVRQTLKTKGPVLCTVFLKPDQKIMPKLEFGKPIEDLSPFIPRDEFNENMIVPPL